jgi:hypothetical protein
MRSASSQVARIARTSPAALLLALGSLLAASTGLAARAHANSATGAAAAAAWRTGSAAGIKARAGRVQSVTDSAHLHLVSADGNTLVESGRAAGTLPGTVEVSLTLGDRTATSSFTIHTSGGTISGQGSGRLEPGKGGYDSFGGSVAVVRGTGRYRGASGTGGLYGAIYRVNDALSVQVTGELHY